MRSFVCFSSSKDTHRVLWASESKSGLYVGLFNGSVDTHYSYHQDGTRHLRIARSHHQRWKDAPLSSHSGVKQLMHGHIPISQAETERRPKHSSAAREDLILVQDTQFSGFSSMAVDVWLADSRNEPSLRQISETAHLRSGYVVVSSRTWDLDCFPNLKFTIAVWAATGEP